MPFFVIIKDAKTIIYKNLLPNYGYFLPYSLQNN